jgi:transcriptional antiterminator RfaH
MPEWYLLRTKVGEERKAQGQLLGIVEDTILPLARARIPQRGRMVERVTPLFPCYIFSLFDLARTARKVRYTPGVRNLVRFGEEVAVVPRWVAEQLAKRSADGPVELSKNRFSPGDSVRVLDGPFRQLEAIFDGYLTGTERVAVLLSIMSAERRVVMPKQIVAAAD